MDHKCPMVDVARNPKQIGNLTRRARKERNRFLAQARPLAELSRTEKGAKLISVSVPGGLLPPTSC